MSWCRVQTTSGIKGSAIKKLAGITHRRHVRAINFRAFIKLISIELSRLLKPNHDNGTPAVRRSLIRLQRYATWWGSDHASPDGDFYSTLCSTPPIGMKGVGIENSNRECCDQYAKKQIWLLQTELVD